MYQIVLCDDNKEQLQKLEVLVKQINHEEIEIISYTNGEALLKDLSKFPKSCIFILDIMLDGMDGIEIAKRINSVNSRASIIFITAYLNLVTDIYNVDHCFFVLKSELQTRIEFALQKAIDQQNKNRELLSIHQNGSRVVFHLEDIIYFERKLRVTYIVLEDDVKKTALKFDSIIKQLPPYFQRCHNSYIINFKKIQKLSRNVCVLKNNNTVPISRAYSNQVKEKFETYIIELV
ncbi:LytR/AlgR family response regulator transcription factor [Amedibacillus sp. YH-ame10]